MADVLAQIRREIDQRVRELRPVVKEYERLQAAADALNGVATPSPPSAGAVKRGGRGRGRARPAGGGERAQQALAIVRDSPGIEIPDIAKRIGIKQNYLYRVLRTLADQGLVKKRGRGWHPTPAAAA